MGSRFLLLWMASVIVTAVVLKAIVKEKDWINAFSIGVIAITTVGILLFVLWAEFRA